ncbi:hypothetical protein BLNAU_9171 [Blattamonas nauphoetae]|uniref:Uncharacterized protein n=1 Tax=Blattamonas nauphoetae TaxID=2049346 RepID=A0ABQ9XWI9_9EUKA|nr:hypothetical protein BLNAU_9171 [Blattamonas nauphoetae]
MNPVDEFTIIPPPSPSLLSISEITETKQPAHDLLHRLFPSPISIQAIGTLFGNTSETYKIRLIAADLFEPISCGHSQTICHTFVYPIRLALQNPDYTSFFFEVVHNKLSSPISQWKSKSYASEHFSNSSNISNITHVIPLYIALQKDDVNNAYHAKNHLIHQFAPSKRCLNVIPESNELPASISKIDAPVVLVLCLVKKQD